MHHVVVEHAELEEVTPGPEPIKMYVNRSNDGKRTDDGMSHASFERTSYGTLDKELLTDQKRGERRSVKRKPAVENVDVVVELSDDGPAVSR